MNPREIREKYLGCKEKLDEHPLINFLEGNYKLLKRYYVAELEEYYDSA